MIFAFIGGLLLSPFFYSPFLYVAWKKRKKIHKVLRRAKKVFLEQGTKMFLAHVIEEAGWFFHGRRQTERERIHPPRVVENKIVFEADGEFADNARALFEYMVDQGYAEHFELVWLVNDPKLYQQKYSHKNIRFVKEARICKKKTAAAFHELRSAKYVFYTIALNWVGIAQDDQVYVDLWHGCSFKEGDLSRKIFFDYCVITSPFFLEKKAKFFQTEESKLLPIGYPRYDTMLKSNNQAENFVQRLLKENGCTKLILWMPTFRHSSSKRLNLDTLSKSSYDLPILSNEGDLQRLNAVCKESGVLLIIKRHHYHLVKNLDVSSLSNVMYIDDKWLEENGLQLYELLHETDSLVTDYSSVGIDYMLLDKPLAFTLDDYEAYKQARGFTVEEPKDYMPGYHIYNMEDFEKYIESIRRGEDEHKSDRNRIKQILHVPCECYSERVLQCINFPSHCERNHVL